MRSAAFQIVSYQADIASQLDDRDVEDRSHRSGDRFRVVDRRRRIRQQHAVETERIRRPDQRADIAGVLHILQEKQSSR
jgi:hypothetical protein